MIKALQPLANGPSETTNTAAAVSKSSGIIIDMLTKGIAPRPEQEIMFELHVLEQLKKKYEDHPTLPLVDVVPKTVSEMQDKLKKMEQDIFAERELQLRLVNSKDKLVTLY